MKYKGRYAIIKIEKEVIMEQEKNKNGVIILLIIIIVVLAILCVLFATGMINLKSDVQGNNEQNNTNDQTVIDSNNTNENVINDNKTDNTTPLKGEIVDNTSDVTSWTKEYSTLTTYKVSKEFCGPPVPTSAFIFDIKNGVLTLTNENTGESATLDGVTNFKSLVYVQLYTSCYSYSIYLLTNDGKLYSSIIPLNEINNVSNLKNIFRLIDLPIKVSEIGAIKTKDVPATAEEVLLKDSDNIEYYGAGNKYYKIS